MSIDKIPLEKIHKTAEGFSYFLKVSSPEGNTLAVLIDHSLAPDIPLLKSWPRGNPGGFNLIGHLSDARESVCPFLIELPTDQGELLQVVEYLIRQCNGQPMFSVLSSPLMLTQLTAHLIHFTQVILPPDNQTYLLRFGDTRIAPTIADILMPEQRRWMFGPITFWCYLDRESNWTIGTGNGVPEIAGGPLLTLSEAQLDAFERATLPDSLTAQLLDEFPDFAATSPSARYYTICRWIAQADKAAGGHASSGECLTYCKDRLAAA
ncbi:MAG: DUF4123 domain-containing protein [Azoarcus sp.]|jgi:hypothetical protein|nr:DUF4123 domain-containing protein [Azoarcus sp.]